MIAMDRRNFIDEHEVLFSHIREEKIRHYESAKRIRKGGLLAANVLVSLFCLSRFIPFEQYSFLNSETGLHDRLSGTRVVRTDLVR